MFRNFLDEEKEIREREDLVKDNCFNIILFLKK